MTYCFLCLLCEATDMVTVVLYHGDNIPERSFARHVRAFASGAVALNILDTVLHVNCICIVTGAWFIFATVCNP
jgi:hypothetical protein